MKRVRPGVATTLAWLAIVAVGGIALGRVITGPLASVVARDLDRPVRNFVTGGHDPDWAHPVWHHPAWRELFAHISVFGTAVVTGVIAAIAGVVWSARTRSPAIAVQLATAFVGAGVLTIVVKFGVNRDPASGPISHFAAGTFPSGHALVAVSVYGTLGAAIWRANVPRLVRWAAAVLLAVLALAVGWSRVFLLDHYASDAVGSVIIGVAWVAVVVHTRTIAVKTAST